MTRFDVNCRKFRDKSEGTQAFIAEFHRLARRRMKQLHPDPHALFMRREAPG